MKYGGRVGADFGFRQFDSIDKLSRRCDYYVITNDVILVRNVLVIQLVTFVY